MARGCVMRAHANRQAQALAGGLRELGFRLVAPTEANGVFVELPARGRCRARSARLAVLQIHR